MTPSHNTNSADTWQAELLKEIAHKETEYDLISLYNLINLIIKNFKLISFIYLLLLTYFD